jgi:hypothetical protein
MNAASGDTLLSLFDQRLELLTEVQELTDRLWRCIEQGKAQRLDRLINRREHALRRWNDVEREISSGVASASGRALSHEQKTRLHELIAGSEDLVQIIIEGNERIERALGERCSAIIGEVGALRKRRKALAAYARDAASTTDGEVDKNA